MQHCKRLRVILKLGKVVLRVRVTLSSVGGGGGGGGGLACQPKCRIRKLLRFFCTSDTVFFSLKWTKK